KPDTIMPTVGADPELIVISQDLSRDLIQSVTRRITAQAARTLRLVALAPRATGLTASNAVDQALTGSKPWSAQAARIYQTESLRLMSLSANQAFEELASYGGVSKMWVWSTIERKEHQAISGQIRRRDQLFDVPLREGGMIQMMFPRDPNAFMYPSAVLNCRCFAIPFPSGTPAPLL
ncbi:MAG: structural protein, partial [Planctomycetota bacterium]